MAEIVVPTPYENITIEVDISDHITELTVELCADHVDEIVEVLCNDICLDQVIPHLDLDEVLGSIDEEAIVKFAVEHASPLLRLALARQAKEDAEADGEAAPVEAAEVQKVGDRVDMMVYSLESNTGGTQQQFIQKLEGVRDSLNQLAAGDCPCCVGGA